MRSEEETRLATEHGFEAVPDKARGSGWHSFKRGDVSIWISRYGWTRASIIDGHYRHHSRYESLGDALVDYLGKPYGPDAHNK